MKWMKQDGKSLYDLIQRTWERLACAMKRLVRFSSRTGAFGGRGVQIVPIPALRDFLVFRLFPMLHFTSSCCSHNQIEMTFDQHVFGTPDMLVLLSTVSLHSRSALRLYFILPLILRARHLEMLVPIFALKCRILPRVISTSNQHWRSRCSISALHFTIPVHEIPRSTPSAGGQIQSIKKRYVTDRPSEINKIKSQ